MHPLDNIPGFCGESGTGEFVDQRETGVYFLGRQRLMNRDIPSNAVADGGSISLNGALERAPTG